MKIYTGLNTQSTPSMLLPRNEGVRYSSSQEGKEVAPIFYCVPSNGYLILVVNPVWPKKLICPVPFTGM